LDLDGKFAICLGAGSVIPQCQPVRLKVGKNIAKLCDNNIGPVKQLILSVWCLTQNKKKLIVPDEKIAMRLRSHRPLPVPGDAGHPG
jgi:hypothetical protein